MILHPDSHLDHGLTPEQVEYVRQHYAGRSGFFIDTFELPEELGSVECGLYGPAVGDDPVHKQAVEYLRRGSRTYVSRVLIGGRTRPTQTVTVVAGPHDVVCPECSGLAATATMCSACYGTGLDRIPCILYTAFGGPLAPKEVNDPNLTDDERVESIKFWGVHALAGVLQ